MSKYVDIYDFVNEIPYVVTEANWRGQMVDAYYMWQAICKMATELKEADVEEVHHGHWIYQNYIWYCSECGKNPTVGMGYVQGQSELYLYCPNCGAKMDNEVTKC